MPDNLASLTSKRNQRNRRFLIRLLGLLIAVIGAPAWANCNAVVALDGSAPLVQYDPFEGLARSDDLIVRVTNAGDTACTLAVSVTGGQPGNDRVMVNGTQRLPYRIETLDGREVPNDASAVIGSVTLPAGAGQQTSLVLRIKVPAGVIGPAGFYEDALTIQVYSIGATTEKIGSELLSRASAQIEVRAQVNISGASGSFGGSPFALPRIDFGPMQTDATRNAFIQVRATTTVGITLSSQNSGQLIHESLGASARVAYAATLDGQDLALASGPSTLDRSPPLSLDGVSYLLILRIAGAVDRLPAGEYSDVLTVSVAPR